MKLLAVIIKSIKEQLRSVWILLLTVTFAPFFVLIYNLITSSYVQTYDVVVYSKDAKSPAYDSLYFYLDASLKYISDSTGNMPFTLNKVATYEEGLALLKDKKADLMLVLPDNIDKRIKTLGKINIINPFPIELVGDLTSISYMLPAIMMEGITARYVTEKCQLFPPLQMKETPLGLSGQRSDFDMAVPGLMVFSIIMIMFTACIAIVTETERKTIQRIKLSGISTTTFLTGISFVQILVGILSVALTLGVAVGMGFHVGGGFGAVLLVSVLISISMIAFSLLLAAFCRTVNDVLVIGNFPLFLFMFFSGSMFPIHAGPLFTISGYEISIISFLSPSHGVSALNKILIMQGSLTDILPEIIALIAVTLLYFVLGLWAFSKRRMRIG